MYISLPTLTILNGIEVELIRTHYLIIANLTRLPLYMKSMLSVIHNSDRLIIVINSAKAKIGLKLDCIQNCQFLLLQLSLIS